MFELDINGIYYRKELERPVLREDDVYQEPKKNLKEYCRVLDVLIDHCIDNPTKPLIGTRFYNDDWYKSEEPTFSNEVKWMTYIDLAKAAISFSVSIHDRNLCPINNYPDEEYENAANMRVLDLYRKYAKPTSLKDVNTICYTSGTTGVAKGCLQTNANFMSMLAFGRNELKSYYCADLQADDILLSYLPCAHVFERIIRILTIALGLKIFVFSGVKKNVLDDIRIGKVTILPAVSKIITTLVDNMDAALSKKSGGLLRCQAIVDYGYQGPEFANLNKMNRRGELLIKGKSIFAGYFRRPDLTRKAFFVRLNTTN
uniref:long-chain-fatty-acid--CoA ligase n=1 Tax=Dermatophagoides pteronyssinus TaxID=6956 RepID=A0A6P6XLQ6_DERPT|nr:long chain acyl-CoA synthetase 2-like [Dermatophagoides pteronyssinus]